MSWSPHIKPINLGEDFRKEEVEKWVAGSTYKSSAARCLRN